MIEEDQTSSRRAPKTKFDRAAEAWAIFGAAVAIIVLAWMVSTI
jgi:hypothetical protein